jgi:hypothetical protein
MQVDRQFKRIEVDIPVTVTTVLETMEASIVDLTEGGAQISGCALPEGTRFHIEYMGETLFSQVRWSEIDRMGVKFLFPLTDGLLYERLMVARSSTLDGEGLSGVSLAMAPIHNGGITRGARTFARVAPGGFGRRG